MAIQLLNKLNTMLATPKAEPKPVAQAQVAAPAFKNDAFLKSAPVARPIPQQPLVKGPAPATDVDFAKQLARNPSLIWNTNASPRTKAAIAEFKLGKKLESGLVYGQSVKGLDLSNKSHAQVKEMLGRRGFTCETQPLKNFHTGKEIINPKTGQAVPQEVWTHADGGMVRVKPEGNPEDKFRPQPHVSVSVKYPPDATSHDFNNEAFKVDFSGNALPKWASDAKNPFPVDTPAGKKFLDDLASRTHVNLR